MSELDEIWSEMLAQAGERARAAQRHDITDYLDLKASNDLIRKTSVGWMRDTLIGQAASANRENVSVTIEQVEPHNFAYRGANLVGTSLVFRCGVRRLTVETGWPRTPGDGFMRGGMLAFARFRHFGMPKAGMEAALYRSDASPVWRTVLEERSGAELQSDDLHRHIRLLIGG